MRKALLFLGILNDNDVDRMIAIGSKLVVPTGTTLIREGKAIESIYIVLDGAFAVTTASLGGKQLAHLKAGEILGEMSFVDSRPPSASVTALENSCVLNIPRNRLGELIEQDVHFACRFYKAIAVFLSDRLRTTVGLLGYSQTRGLEQERAYVDEIDADTLDHLELAGARFDLLQKKLRAL
jgi:CRP/FNR family transcriptional regulator, cyclic AMP receptor protein